MTLGFDGSDDSFLQKSPGDFIKEIVGQTSGFLPRDIRALVADAGANLIPRGSSKNDRVDPTDASNYLKEQAAEDGKLSSNEAQVLEKEDLSKALERSKKRNVAALGTPKVNLTVSGVLLLFAMSVLL